MVKAQSRSTSASLEARFASFSKIIVIFEPFVNILLPAHPYLAHTWVEVLEGVRGVETPVKPLTGCFGF